MTKLILAIGLTALLMGCQHGPDYYPRQGDASRQPGTVDSLPRSAWPDDAVGTRRVPQ